MPGDEIDHIEELQKHLYARDPENVPQQKYGILRPIRQNVVSTWGDKDVPKKKSLRQTSLGGYRRFFLISLVFFLLAGGFAYYSVFHGAVTISGKNVDVSILGNAFVAAGEELPIQVEVSNKNATDLLDVDLALDYPKGATDETGSEITHLAEQLGTVSSGKTKSAAFSVTLYGEQGTVRTLTATLSYHLPNSTATFQKKQTFAVTINSSPITLTVDGPSVAATNQTFSLVIRSLFTGEQSVPNGIIRVEYPSGYSFQSATPAPISGNNVWNLGALEKGSEQTITVRGKLTGIQNDERSFRVYLGSPTSSNDYRIATTYNSTLHTVTIDQPFVTADIYIEGENSDIASLPINSTVRGWVQWTNISNTELTNPSFTLSLAGNGFSMQGVQAEDAYVDSLNRTITWNANSSRDIVSLQPGQSGTLPFTIQPINGNLNDIKLSLGVEAVPAGTNETKMIEGLDEVTVRYAAQLQFASQALYSSGPFKNTGPFPPKVNLETSYTLTWTIRPTNNPITGAIATATLPQGVVWAGAISPQSESITYNPDTREIRWNIGSLPKATNIPLSKSVSFQVKAKPTANQIGAELDLLSETEITANDAVASVPIHATRPALTTRLETDSLYTTESGRVVP